MKESRDVRGLAWGLLFLFLCPVAFLLVMTFIDDHTRTDLFGSDTESESTPAEETPASEGTPSAETPADATPSAEAPSDVTPQAETPTEESTETPSDGTPVSQLPASDVSFAADIVPIFEQHCYTCHGPNRIPGVPTSYSLVSYDTTLRGGFIPAVVPGKPEESSLYLGVSTFDMPRDGNRLSDAEIELIRLWILQGARNN